MSVSVSYVALPSDMETVDTLDGFLRTLVPERWAHPGEGRPETAGLVGGNPDAIVMYTNLVKGISVSNRVRIEFSGTEKKIIQRNGLYTVAICCPFFHEQNRGKLGNNTL